MEVFDLIIVEQAIIEIEDSREFYNAKYRISQERIKKE